MDSHPDITSINTVNCDLNGGLRGKRMPRSQAKKAYSGAVKLPLSTMGVDIWGADAMGSGQVLETGDNDGICLPTERDILPINWLSTPTALIQTWMFNEDRKPYTADPRQALAAILARYKAIGLTPVCATELEFYLYDPKSSNKSAPLSPISGKKLTANDVYSVACIDQFDGFLNDVYAACQEMGILADAAISENGCGQFEINLLHVPDALKAADDAFLFKYVVKGVARKHGFGATFMAKPYGDQSGSGMHVHFSIIDKAGINKFDDGTAQGSDLLRNAVAGLLASMEENMLLFAPHFNSFRRLREGTHAPINIAWGYDNRTTAVRIPSGPNVSRRIEQRVAGADANPYLVLAAVLGGALIGIEQKLIPVPAVAGNAYAEDLPILPTEWGTAISRFEQAEFGREIFSDLLRRMLIAAKRQEQDGFAARVSAFELQSYLDAV